MDLNEKPTEEEMLEEIKLREERGRKDFMACKGLKKGYCDCTDNSFMAVEYSSDHPDHYDGISEWICSNCKRRWGRWNGKELTGDESEKPPI